MSTTITEEPTGPEPGPDRRLGSWLGLLAGLSILVGVLAGVFWAGVVDLPAYRILADGTAVMSERGLVEVVSADAWFVITGALCGLGLGLVTWKWFSPLGWPVAFLAAGAALLAALACWPVGMLLGPGNEADRLATAQPGDLVPIALQLRSMSALAVWAFAAVTPVLLIAALGPDEEDHAPRRRRRAQQVEPEPGEIDERGVLTSPGEVAG